MATGATFFNICTHCERHGHFIFFDGTRSVNFYSLSAAEAIVVDALIAHKITQDACNYFLHLLEMMKRIIPENLHTISDEVAIQELREICPLLVLENPPTQRKVN